METGLHEALEKYGRFPTYPVGIKFITGTEEAPNGTKYPLRDIGQCITLCQGLTISRTLGWSLAFHKEDHGCPLPRVFLGHVSPEKFLSGRIAKSYQPNQDCARTMEASIPRLPLNSVQQVWLSPLARCEFEPDLAVVYGNPGQILTLIHAANYGEGTGIASSSMGRAGCATWIAGIHHSKACTYMIPGSGERVFGGTQDHEMSFAIPHCRFLNIVEGLKYIRKHKSYRYPVPNLAILSRPRIPELYFSIDPERDQCAREVQPA